MTISVKAGGSNHTVSGVYAKAGGVIRTIQQGWANVSGTWHQFYAAFGGSTSNYSSGSGSETVPTGASSVTVTAYGPGGDGGAGFDDGIGDIFNGGGGGGGAKVIRTLAIAAADWGGTIPWSVGVHGSSNTTVSKALTNGTISVTAARGGNGADDVTPGGGGAASGGDTNQSGNDGTTPDGGAAIDGYGAGGDGTDDLSTHNPGGPGHITFVWS